MSISSIAIQYTLRPTWRGHVVYVRESVPAHIPGEFVWGWWRVAKDHERDIALKKLMELNYE